MHKSMSVYVDDIQSTCDSLASCGHVIEHMQHVSIILNGVKVNKHSC